MLRLDASLRNGAPGSTYLGSARRAPSSNHESRSYLEGANLAGFISGCYSNDLEMIRESFNGLLLSRSATH